jgi:CheY-like chemotaxis protein/DNA repair exonuclease SbcCD ATPase subunit
MMERTKLLLIDGERDFAEAVIKTLGGSKLDVTWSGNAEEGEQTARSWKPDVVVIDVNLPDGNGFKLFTRLYRHTELTGARYVITGEGIPEKTFLDHQNLKRHADLYIHKPFRPDELRARLQSDLGLITDETVKPPKSQPRKGSKPQPVPITKTRSAGRDEDYLDELDNLLGDVDESAFKPNLRDDDADLNELNRLLGGETDALQAAPQPPPMPVSLDTATPPAPPDEPELAIDEDDNTLEELNNLPLEDKAVTEDADLDSLALKEVAPGDDLEDLLEEEEIDAALSGLSESDKEELQKLEETPEDDPIADVRESEVAALIDNLENTRRERDAARSQIERLNEQLKAVQAPTASEGDSPEYDKLKRALKKAQDVAQLKTQESAEMARYVDELQHANGELTEELDRLRAKLKTQTDEVAAQYRDKLAKTMAKIDELTAALNDVNAISSETNDLHTARIATLEKEIDGLNREVEQTTNERNELLAEVERQKEKAEVLVQRERQAAAEQIEREKTIWQQRLEDASSDSEEADKRLDALHERISELESLLDTQSREHERMLEAREEQELANHNKLEQQHEQQLASLNEQLTAAREISEHLEESREALKSELNALGDKVAQQRATISELKAQLKTAQDELAEREKRMADQSHTESRMEELEAEVELLRSTNSRNEKRVIDAFTRLKADIEARARVEKALMLALKLIKSPSSSKDTAQQQNS